MKRFAHYITCCTLIALCACTHDEINDVVAPVGNGKITIESSLDDLLLTRAFNGESAKERTVEHIDVFAVDENDNIAYYERNTTSGNNGGAAEDGSGKLTLNAARRAKIGEEYVFEPGKRYSFYLVANSRTPSEDIEDLATLSDLQKWVFHDTIKINSTETQTKLHLTGTTLGKTNDANADLRYPTPQTFLMDAVAQGGSETSFVVNPETGNVTNLELTAEFKRAAAKILVNIKQGPDVTFHKSLAVEMVDKESGSTSSVSERAKYYFYKLPSSTFVLPNEQKLVDLQLITTATMDAPQADNDNPGTEQVFKWQENIASDDNVDVQVLGYTYAHQWSDVDLTNETSLILNIPLWYREEDESNPNRTDEGIAPAPNSWYKVPLSKDKIFERNKCYVVNITINAVGATNRSDAIELRDIEYATLEWQDVGIDVGNEDNRPAYLELNTDLVEMYNVNFDNSSLSFSSSSPITSVVLKDVYKQNEDGTFSVATDSYSAYYINKFGLKTNLNSTVRASVSATAEQGVLNGGINILSPILPTTEQERELALEALGEAPTLPTEVAEPSGKPDPNDYLGEENGYPTEDERPTASAAIYNSNDRTFTVYRYNETTGTFQSRTDTCTRNGRFNHTYSWSNGSWTDIETPADYVTAVNAWAAQHPEYLEYLKALEAYNAYQAAKTAIENSGSAEESHYNTVRYLEFEVTNEQGLKATFRVMQYPVIYITNQQGWYSYRDDFGSSYENKGDRNVRIRLSMTNNSWNGGYIYDTTAGTGNSENYSSRYFWQSKVVSSYNEDTGKSTTSFYSWAEDSNAATATIGGNCETDANARMYHIRVTATSQTYTIGKPRLDSDGFTDSSNENAKLVSPSFMIASRLGAIYSSYGGLGSVEDGVDNDNDNIADRLEIFRDHCKNYVEVYQDTDGNSVVLDDWRLPTAAEIKIIIDLQGGQDDDAPAIDYLLNGYYYMSANGPVSNPKGNNDNTNTSAIRCVRDAY